MKGVNKYVSELVCSIGQSLHGKDIKTELSTKMKQSVFIVVSKNILRFNKKWVIENRNNKTLTIVINYAVYEAISKSEYTAYSVEKIKEIIKEKVI